jgi:SAM-dependent methyltransferase
MITDLGQVFIKDTPCNICGNNAFSAFNSTKPRRCTVCGSIERTRTAFSLLKNDIINLSEKKILHISPSNPERKIFELLDAKNVTTIDIRPEVKADLIADICNMLCVASESYDLVFANCVLNHVYDDETALSEIKRILKKDGLFVVWVLGNGKSETTTDIDPTAWYGKENMEKYRIGTFRHYGDDFNTQLKRYFSNVKPYTIHDETSDISCLWHVCER